MGKQTQQYMYCRSSTRYCRPQKNSTRPRFTRHQQPKPSFNLEMLQHLFSKVKAGVYVLPKSILPPLLKKISRHSGSVTIHRVCLRNSPTHRSATSLFISLDILLVKVKISGICPAEALCDTATPVKKFPYIQDDPFDSTRKISMETHLLDMTHTTTKNRTKPPSKTPSAHRTFIGNQLGFKKTPPHHRQVSVSTLFTNKLTFKVKCQLTDVRISRDWERHSLHCKGLGGVHDDFWCNSDIYVFTPNSPICIRE